jgi:hypothetical protein
MLRVLAADSSAPPAEAWALLAEPSRWSEWAPHVRGAWGLGSPEVEAGRRGAARLLGVIPVPAKVTQVEPGRSWSWHVGPLRLDHTVHPTPVGCRVSTTLHGPAVLTAPYGAVVQLLMRRLASRAAAASTTS